MICLAVLGTAQAATAQPAAQSPAVAPQPANAMQLARLLNPEDSIVAASDRAFKTGFEAALANDEQTGGMMKEHPALLEAIYAGTLPVVRKQVAASMPRLHRRSADFYAGRFTPTVRRVSAGGVRSETRAPAALQGARSARNGWSPILPRAHACPGQA